MTKVAVSWSSGKDSAFLLGELRAADGIDVEALVTSIEEAADRVPMHAVRRELLERQAAALDLPLDLVPLPNPCPNDAYEVAMRAAFARLRERGIEAVAYGDLHLADVRAYRERLMEGSGLRPLFPLWDRETGALARQMIAAGQRAIVTCVDSRRLGREFAGRDFDTGFLADLPDNVDPCGENGEFHSFVYDGPGFREALCVERGATIERDGFLNTDLRPND